MLRFIKVERNNAYVGALAKYGIAIDGVVRDQMANHETKVFVVDEGPHTISFVGMGKESPRCDIPAGKDSLIFCQGIKMGLLVSTIIPKYVGTYTGNISECSEKEKYLGCEMYINQKKNETIAYIREFRAWAPMRNIAEMAAHLLVEKDLVDFEKVGEVKPIIPNPGFKQFALSFDVELDANGVVTITCGSNKLPSIYCTELSVVGWSKEKKLAFQNVLAEGIAAYWNQPQNILEFRRLLNQPKSSEISLKSFPLEEAGLYADYKYRPDHVEDYNLPSIGRIRFDVTRNNF